MREIYICWLDDIKGFVSSLTDKIELIESDSSVKFIIDEHYSTTNFDSIARNIGEGLIFFIDYNLKGNDGAGLDGNEVIALIREHNQDCEIVFYSSNATQTELRELVGEFTNVTCTLRENLAEILVKIASK